MRLPMVTELNGQSDMRHRIRDLRFFEESFRKNVQLTLPEGAARSKTDQARLRASFLAWLESFQATRHLATIDRKDYICFAAGSMLAELFRHDPLSLASEQEQAEDVTSAWPKGSAYVSYCLGVALTVLEQEFHLTAEIPESANDPRIWQSFKENVQENPDLAIPFLDMLLGQSPNWTEPNRAEKRPAVTQKSTRAIST
jgi:hypothetical protein